MYLSLLVSIYLYWYLSTGIYLSIYRYLSISTGMYLSIYRYLSISTGMYLSISTSIYHPYIYPSISRGYPSLHILPKSDFPSHATLRLDISLSHSLSHHSFAPSLTHTHARTHARTHVPHNTMTSAPLSLMSADIA